MVWPPHLRTRSWKHVADSSWYRNVRCSEPRRCPVDDAPKPEKLHWRHQAFNTAQGNAHVFLCGSLSLSARWYSHVVDHVNVLGVLNFCSSEMINMALAEPFNTVAPQFSFASGQDQLQPWRFSDTISNLRPFASSSTTAASSVRRPAFGAPQASTCAACDCQRWCDRLKLNPLVSCLRAQGSS